MLDVIRCHNQKILKLCYKALLIITPLYTTKTQHTVQKYANWHVWDLNNSNGTIDYEIKVGILDNTCFKENVVTFEILGGWILRLGLNF